MTDESIFAAALAIPSPSQRAVYLDRACAGNPSLRREVEALLAAHAASNPLDRPPADLGHTGAYEPDPDDPPPAATGDRIGPYRLMELIGEGGFGLVFVAEQSEPVRRKVALKVLKPGMDTRDVVARFEAERQALALMDHPNIAQVFDAGSTPTGRPYFVMELVRGVPITDYCDQHKLPPRDRLALFVQVCHAVQHAHQKGVIHRDLKPGNVLVTAHDGVPVSKVIDFGVAKAVGQALTEKTIYTRFAQMIGTPLYMSPEQAEMSGLDVDTRADVYALGVLLYELLTGTTPFDRDRFRKAAFDEIRRILRDEEPPRPSTRLTTLGATLSAVSASRATDATKLAGLVRGELDWIVMRCLEKDRSRRYETANGLARDVQRYLAGDAVEACPPTLGYQLRKAFRKHRTAGSVAAGFAAVLLLGTGLTAWQAVRATHAEASVARERDDALAAHQVAETERNNVSRANASLSRLAAEQRRTLYDTSMNLAQAAWETGDPARTIELLRDWVPKPGEDDLRDFEWRYWEHFAHLDLKTIRLEQFDEVSFNGRGARLSPDGNGVAAFTIDAVDATLLKFWNAQTGKVLWSAPVAADTGSYPHMGFSKDGRRLVTARRLAGVEGSQKWHIEVRVYDTATGKPIYTLDPPDATNVTYPALSPDGSLVAVVLWGAAPDRQPRMSVRRLADDKEVFRYPSDDAKDIPFGLTFDPDGKRLAALIAPGGSRGVVLTLWDTTAYAELQRLPVPGSQIWGVAFSPDGARVATVAHGGPNEQIFVWDGTSGKQLQVLNPSVVPGPFTGIYPMVFDPSGKWLAIPKDTQVHLLDAGKKPAANGEPLLRSFRGHEAMVLEVVFAANGSRLVTLDRQGFVKQWDPAARTPLPRTPFLASISYGAWPSPDGKWVAFIPERGDPDPRLRLADASGRAVSETSLPRGFGSARTFSPDGRRFALLWHRNPFFGNGAELYVWDASTGKEVCRLVAPTAGQSIGQFALNADGSRVAALTWSSIGNPMVGSSTLVIWETATGRVLVTRPDQEGNRPTYSPDGRWIVLAEASPLGTEDRILFLDAQTGQEVVSRKMRKGILSLSDRVAFSRDGRRLAIFSLLEQPTVTIWETDDLLHREAPEPLVTLTGHGGDVTRVEFSPDNRRILTSGGGVVKLWDTVSGREVLTLKAKGLRLGEALFSPDGHTIWGGLDEDGRLWGWDGTPVPEGKTP